MTASSMSAPGWSEMDEAQFQRWARLIEEHTGMVLPHQRKSFLTTNLGLRMQEIGCRDYQEYYDHLHTSRDRLVEWATLVDRLTVHETRFFRHPDSLRLIRRVSIPALLSAKAPSTTVQAWSVGCATGQEAYTLAMVLDEALSEAGHRAYFGVVGTDISAAALDKARRGVYAGAQLKGLEPEHLARYFEPVAGGGGRYRVCESLRRRVCFARMNVLDSEHVPFGDMDIIYCQNLLIYFGRRRRIEIVERLIQRLRPGGVLILGPGELVNWTHPDLVALPDPQTRAFQRRYETVDGVKAQNQP